MNRIPKLAATEMRTRTGWPEFTALAFYTALVAFAIPWHEPWADEAQSWQLARSLSLTDLFRTYVRYEGSPGLWHFLLWILNRLHIGYTGLHWICGAIAVASTALLVLKSPFPRYIKLLLPFTYFLLFQYAVVARSYVLVPGLLYLIALCWKKNPLLVALLLGLLANVALHATVISGGLASVYLIEQVRDGGARDQSRRRQLLLASLILLCFWAFAVWTALPPHDLSYRTSEGPLIFNIIHRIIVLCFPWALPIPFWIAIALCFRARSRLIYLLPVALCGLFCLVKYANMWHVGLLYPLVITMLWITWPPPQNEISKRESAGRIAVVLLAALQILWSVYAIRFDHFNAYSPDLATAEFLRPMVQRGANIVITSVDDPGCDACRAVGILPYFDRNIFSNMPDPFWLWSINNHTLKNFGQALSSHPDVAVVELRTPKQTVSVNPQDHSITLLRQSGYTFTHMFCGARPMGLRIDERSCHLIFQYTGSLPAPAVNAVTH